MKNHKETKIMIIKRTQKEETRMHSTSLQRGCKKKNTNLNGQKGIEKMEIK